MHLYSLIESFLGPNKNFKFIISGTETSIVCCPIKALQTVVLKEPVEHIVEQTLQAHHEYYGYGTSTLLAMWYFWDQQFKALLDKGYEARNIIEVARNALNHVISLLPTVVISTKTFLCLVDKELQMSQQDPFIKNVSYSQYQRTSMPCKRSSSIFMPRRSSEVMLRSRHFSPVISQEDGSSSYGCSNISDKFCFSKQSHDVLLSFVNHLCRCSDNLSQVLAKAWEQQIKISKSTIFHPEYLSVCNIPGTLRKAELLNGLLLRTRKNYVFPNAVKKHKALLIHGDITAEFMHVGFAPSACVKNEKSLEHMHVSRFKIWEKQCITILQKLQVSLLFVCGNVDPAIVSFCCSNSISLISNITWNELQLLMNFWQSSPVTYLLDCNEGKFSRLHTIFYGETFNCFKDVSSHISLAKWQHETLQDLDDYILLSDSRSTQVCLHTIILYHPSSAFLELLNHQFFHDMSRLSFATKSSKVLPGSTQTEIWCIQQLKQLAAEAKESEKDIIAALADGFASFSTAVSKKIDLDENGSEVFDEMNSKTQAWNSALALSFITLNCDLVAINDCDKNVVDEKHGLENYKSFLGHL